MHAEEAAPDTAKRSKAKPKQQARQPAAAAVPAAKSEARKRGKGAALIAPAADGTAGLNVEDLLGKLEALKAENDHLKKKAKLNQPAATEGGCCLGVPSG